MPSYLANETIQDFASNIDDELAVGPHDRFDITAAKNLANGETLSGQETRHISESLDDRSTLSTNHDSEISGTLPMHLNGTSNGTRPTSMGSITNTHSNPRDDNSHDAYQVNGITSEYTRTLPDRTLANGNGNGNGNALKDRETMQFPGAADSDPQSIQNRNSPTLQATNLPWPAAPNTSSSSSSKPPTESVAPTSHAELAPPKPSPHRFSSPPAYQPGNSTLNSSHSGHLLPPGQAPVLKQRHTLELPKPGPPSRTSKDGWDSGHSTGRFSPTTAGGSGTRRTSMNLGRRNTRSMLVDIPRDEVVPDEDALRWAEAYRQKRASKRRRKEEEDDDRVLVGTKVDEKHANWVTAYNMLTGIRVSVSRTNAKLDRELTDADFEAKQKSTFDIAGNELVPSAKYDFKFKDYAPWVFRRLRALFRLDPADYLMSLTGKYILSELGSPGKSGSFFYFSRDYKYIIKTIHHAEHKFMRKILKDYYTHVQENPNTLLSQFYGLHRVKMPYGKKIHFVVMNNLFPPHRDIHTTFDLKGSTIGRDYREEDLEKNPRATLKDLNWLRRQRNLELGIQKKRLFLEQLQKDVVLLKRLQIMDYSLLVGIHDLSRGNDENLRGKTLRIFNPGGEKSPEEEPPQALHRTPSKMETARKARELRQMIRQERPVPMGDIVDKMPDVLGEGHTRPGFVFNQDDGGVRATHENNAPADEIYYLGVIDCLTHYGIIKKIEHFWKGLSSDRTQISALPPDQYGDRFYNFVEGITMSHEEAQREALRREKEAMEEANHPSEKTATHKGKQKAIPPMPTHQPPAPPTGPSSSDQAKDTIDKAHQEARRNEKAGAAAEQYIPDRVLMTTAVAAEGRNSQHEPILPVVEEAGEGKTEETPEPTRSRWRLGKIAPPTHKPPPPPPQDVSPTHTGSPRGAPLNRESLDKDLPPLPENAERQDSGVRMVA